jgi:hypothetical protein
LGERCPGERRVLAFERPGRHVLRGTRPIYDEEINAAVILRPGASATAQEQARLAAFEVPKRFCFATSLPRTAKESDDRRQLAITLRAEAMNLARTSGKPRDECPVPEFLFYRRAPGPRAAAGRDKVRAQTGGPAMSTHT